MSVGLSGPTSSYERRDMEQLEQAEKFETMFREHGILAARAQLPRGESKTHCEECEEPIPEARRQAVKGCKHCVDCAELLQRKPAWQR